MTLHTSGASSIAATNNGAAVTQALRHAHCCKALKTPTIIGNYPPC